MSEEFFKILILTAYMSGPALSAAILLGYFLLNRRG